MSKKVSCVLVAISAAQASSPLLAVAEFVVAETVGPPEVVPADCTSVDAVVASDTVSRFAFCDLTLCWRTVGGGSRTGAALACG
jgi:hypothetical protein